MNRALCRFLGYTEQESPDRDWLELTHPDDVAISATEITALFAGDRASFAVEKRYVRSDGRPVWAQVNVSLLRGRDGVPLFRLTQHVDIDARKQEEQHLRELNDAQIDQGPGIPTRDRHAVFEPFYRAAPDHPHPGTGIGLSLVARTTALHDGTAWLQDTEHGTHVAVALPDLPRPVATVQPSGSAPASLGA